MKPPTQKGHMMTRPKQRAVNPKPERKETMKVTAANLETVLGIYELTEEGDDLLKKLQRRGVFLRDGNGTLFFWCQDDASRVRPGAAFTATRRTSSGTTAGS